jgi:hypothetical protein
MREIYASEEVMMAVADPFGGDGEAADHLSEFRQTMDAFLEGGEFSVSEDPYNKPSDAMLARVDPVEDEIWDIRSITPHPGIRCLGAFHSKDRFIALTWDYRVNIVDWKAEIQSCKDLWRDIFGAVKPLSASKVDDYLCNYILAI